MRKWHGIAVTDHGTFYYSMVGKTSKGLKIKRSREWNSGSFFNNYLLLHTPVNLSLPAFWTKQLPADTNGTISVATQGSFAVSVHQTEYDHFSNLLEPNIVGIYPHDVFLATLPRFFVADAPGSFVSLFFDDPVVKIGLIIDNTLVAVYSAIITSCSELTGFIGRIERYWKLHNPVIHFPAHRFLLNSSSFDMSDMPEAIPVSCGTRHSDTLKSVGCALCGSEQTLPRLNQSTPLKKPGMFRTVLLAVSLLLLSSTLLTSAGIFAYVKYSSIKLHSVKNRYQNILNNNTEIRQLITEGNRLSQKVLLHNELLSHPTTWGKFLHFLGTSRPDGLFFDRLGSEPIKDDRTKMHIVLTGWCSSETIATEYIKTLSKSPLLQNISLSSIERIPKQEALCNFKILCILLLSEK